MATRVNALIEGGLRRYGKGDLDGALGEWELALALDPDAKVAEEYIAYVRENFEALSASFRAEREAVEQVRAEGIPVPEDDGGSDDDDLYAEIEVSEVSVGDLASQVANGPAAVSPSIQLSHEMGAVDDGWDLGGDVGDVAAQLADAGTDAEPSTPGGMPIVTVRPRPSSVSETPLEDALLAGGATADDFEYGDLPEPAAAPGPDLALQTTPDAPFQEPVPEDELDGPTVAREPRAGAASGEPSGEEDENYALEFQNEFSQQSTGAVMAGQPTVAAPPPADTAATTRDPMNVVNADSGVTVREPLRRRTTRDPLMDSQELPIGGPPPPLEGYDDLVDFVVPGTAARRRTTSPPAARRPDSNAETVPFQSVSPKPERLAKIFAHIKEAAERSDYPSAAQAAEAFFEEDPTLEHLDFREREMLMRIYEAHLGRMDQVPLVAVPMQQIAAAQLDHRTGFLLSRIDGMLTYEDILDVAGMPRMEAYRILSNLLSRGFLEVR